jgi:hypothetical protein
MRKTYRAKTQIRHKHTRNSFFSLLISPVLIRVASAAQSAAETSQLIASISSQSTSNSLQPKKNFTSAMKYVYAASGYMLCSKCPADANATIAASSCI